MNSPTKYRVFISAASEDYHYADRVFGLLTALGVPAFFAGRTMDDSGIAAYRRVIDDALDSADHMVVVGSCSEYLTSPWVRHEWTTFSNECLAGRKTGNLITVSAGTLPLEQLPITLRQNAVIALESDSLELSLTSYLARPSTNARSERMPIDTSPKHAVRGHAESHVRDLKVVSVHELEDAGWSVAQIIDALIAMDYATLGGASECDVGSTSEWWPVVTNNVDGMRLVVTPDRQIIGYWHFLPLTDTAYAAALEGILDDGSISLDHVNILGPPGDYNLYFMIIAIEPKFRGVRVLRMLMDAFVTVLLDLSRHGIYFPDMCAVAFTPEGEAMCRTMRMDNVGSHHARGRIFRLNLRDLPAQLFYNPELRNLYHMHYARTT